MKPLAMLLAAGAIVFSCYAFVNSGLFTLRKVLIYGNRHLGYVQVVELAGLRGGENLLTLDLEGVYENLHSSAWIRSVSMRKELPDTLVIRLEESRPVALLQSAEGLFVVDSEGLLLERVSEAPVYFLPVIVHQGADGSEEFSEAVKLASVINDIKEARAVELVEIAGLEDGSRNMVVRLDGVDIRVGEGSYREKLLRYFELSREIGRRNINVDYIDLRFANRVVVKPLEEAIQ
jgi:cell division protein FtsQ